MTHKKFFSLMEQFVERYNKLSQTGKGYYRLIIVPCENAVKLTPEYGNCIFWPEQVFRLAHDYELLMYLTAEPWVDGKMQPVITLFPPSGNAC